MAVQVTATNSAEAKAVRERKSEITGLWENLKVGGLSVYVHFVYCIFGKFSALNYFACQFNFYVS